MPAKARAAPTLRHPAVHGVAVAAAEVDATAPTSAPREKLSATAPETRGVAAEAAERSNDAVRDARIVSRGVTSIVMSPGAPEARSSIRPCPLRDPTRIGGS